MNYCNSNKNSLVLKRSPGKGCIDELYELFLLNGGIEATMNAVYKLDKHEQF